MSVVYQALNQITGGLLFDQLSDYHDSNHFDLLWESTWSAAFPPDIPIDTTDFFVVVNGAIPDGKHPQDPVLLSVNFAAHFGALSWAASHLIALSRLPGERRCGIVIVDPSSPTGGPATLLQRMFRGGADDGGGVIPNVIHLIDPGLEEILTATNTLKECPPAVDPGQVKLLSALLHSAIVAERADHHAIGNVLGSYILKNEAGESFGIDGDGKRNVQDESMPLQYQVTALCKCIWEHSVSPWRTKTKEDPFGSEKIVGNVLLIDDLADLWKPVLEQALPLAVVSTILRDEFLVFLEKLPARLESIWETGEKVTPRKLTDFAGDSDSTDFVLFLDLRLLPETDPRRAGFYKNLAKLAMTLDKHMETLPWLGGRDERSGWASWLKDIVSGKESHPEPLLAQIISLIDPTLPIIVFSSSHASDFTDPLAPFGNLSTGFRKPTPAIMPELRMPILKKEFAQTCERAARVKHIRHLLTEGFVEDPNFLPATCEHCEIFIDEGGSYVDDRMNISGIAVCGGADSVQAFHEDLHSRFLAARSPGVTCFHQAVAGSSSANRPGSFFPKRPETKEEWADHWKNVQNLAKEAQDCAVAANVNLLAFTSEFPTDGDGAVEWMRLGDLDQERQILDVGYTARMVEVLGILTFDVLMASHRCSGPPVTVGIDLGTRDAVANSKGLVGNPAGLKELRNRLKFRWGVRTEGDAIRLQSKRKSIDDRTPLRLFELALTGAFGSRVNSAKVEVVHARGCFLTNWKTDNHITAWDDGELMPKPLHYLADFLANAINRRDHKEARSFLEGQELQGWFDHGFKLLESDDSLDWVEILSDWDSGQRVLAIQKVITAGEEQRNNAPAFVRAKIHSWNTNTLSDQDLRSLFATAFEI